MGRLWPSSPARSAIRASQTDGFYDLETGRPLWEAGGPSNGEAFDPPLAGYFFFGPPVADGDDLFVVGESTSGETNKQIRLICLDPENRRSEVDATRRQRRSPISRKTCADAGGPPRLPSPTAC